MRYPQINGTYCDHIVATTMMYFDSINMTSTSGAIFLHPMNHLHKQDPLYHLEAYCLAHEDEGMERPYKARDWEGDDSQSSPSINCPDGRLIAYSNAVIHGINSFELLDENKPGRRRYLKLHLVDRTYKLCSTRNVPPQQREWFFYQAMSCVPWSQWGIPSDVLRIIGDYVRLAYDEKCPTEWPISQGSAEELQTRYRDIQRKHGEGLYGKVANQAYHWVQELAETVYKVDLAGE